MSRSARLLGHLMLVVAAAVLLGGCNTIEGIGEDVESAGDAVQDAADGD